MKSVTRNRYACLVSLVLILGGCVPFPRFVEEPYTDEVPSLKIGVTTKKDVLYLLGEPGATYARESEYVYAEFEAQLTIIGPNATLGELHYLVLSFSEDDVLSKTQQQNSLGSQKNIAGFTYTAFFHLLWL